MEYFEGKERFWEKRHCHLFGSLGVRKQMEQGEMRIRPEPQHPEEFLRAARQEMEKSRYTERVDKIRAALMEREVDFAGKCDGTPQPVARAIMPLWYYYWYYKDLLMAMFRKRFPQKWEHIQ